MIAPNILAYDAGGKFISPVQTKSHHRFQRPAQHYPGASAPAPPRLS